MRRLIVGLAQVLLLIFLLGASLAPSSSPFLAQAPTMTVSPTVGEVTTVPVYGLFETEIDPGLAVANPYNPAQIDILAQFSSPTGRLITVTAFLMQPYSCPTPCVADGGQEPLQAVGKPVWRVRFTPDEVGSWSYTVQVRFQDTMQTLSTGTFTALVSNNMGFIRVGTNRRYFARTTGETVFPVGFNLGWAWEGVGNTAGYLKWLTQLRDSGANWGRLYLDVPWFIGLEWKGRAGSYAATQVDAWRLDTILQQAEAYGISLQLVLVWSQGFVNFQGLPVNPPLDVPRPNTDADWNVNPLNQIQGGPFPNVASYFSTTEGRDYIKRRLRYIVARWAASPAIFGWEVIDQIDRPVDPQVGSAWLKDVVTYLREIDPYQHPITSGLRDPKNEAMLDPVVLDYRITRLFQRRPIEPAGDQAFDVLTTLNPFLAVGDRPVLLTEFSINPWFEPTADDPSGVHVRQSAWVAALSGSAGSAMSAWWDTYIFRNNLQSVLAPLTAFMQGLPLASSKIAPTSLIFANSDATSLEPYKISGFGGSFGQPPGPDVVYRLTSDGMIPPIATQSAYIYGQVYNKELNRPQKYLFTPPTDTSLTVTIRRGSEQAAAKLAIYIDGQLAGQLGISPGATNLSFSVPIKAGERQVWIDNTGEDFLQLESIQIDGYILPLRTLALADRDRGILLALIQHRAYNWQGVGQNLAIQPINATVSETGMQAGAYRVQYWDPIGGNVVGEEQIVVAAENVLTMVLPPVNTMLAIRAERLNDAGAQPPTALPTATPLPQQPLPTITPTMPKVVG